MKNPIIQTQKISKKELVKNWLLAGRTITHRQCSRMFGGDRLADIIYKLRGEGMKINAPLKAGQDRFLNAVHYAVYKWAGEKPRFAFRIRAMSITTYHMFHRYAMTTALKKNHVKKFMEKIAAIKKINYQKKRNVIVVHSASRTYLFWIYLKP